MKALLKSYKTEVKPTLEQKQKINQTIGTSRFIYNFYLAHNKEHYEKDKTFISGITFSKWLNNEFLPNNPEYLWIKNVSSKSTKQSIMYAEKAYKNFFKGNAGFPRFKKKSKSDVKMYFVKTDIRVIIPCERHRIKIPTLGWVRLKEKNYLPVNPNTHIIKSGTISHQAGRYYISILVEQQEVVKTNPYSEPIGIDLGLKDFAVISNNKSYKNINKTLRVKKIEKKLKKEQVRLSRKYECLKNLNKTRKDATSQNIHKQKLKVQKLHQKLTNIRTDYINKIVSEIVEQKPSSITIEDLNIKGMMSNRHLSKAISKQKFYEFRTKLTIKCKQNNIELRIADKFYPSSKTCSCCGNIKKDLKLSDRIYVCNECGFVIDRDLQASINLRELKTYNIT